MIDRVFAQRQTLYIHILLYSVQYSVNIKYKCEMEVVRIQVPNDKYSSGCSRKPRPYLYTYICTKYILCLPPPPPEDITTSKLLLLYCCGAALRQRSRCLNTPCLLLHNQRTRETTRLCNPLDLSIVYAWYDMKVSV